MVKSADDQYVDANGTVVQVTATLTEAKRAADGSGAIYYNNGTGWVVATGTPATPPPSDAEIAAFPQAKDDANGNLLVADAATGDLYWKPDYVTTGANPKGVNQGTNVTTVTTNTEVFKEPAFVDADGKAIVPQPDASKLTAVYKIGNDEFYKATDGSYVNVVNGTAYTLPSTAAFPLPESSGDYGPKFVTQTGPAPGVAPTTYEQAEFKKADGTYLTAEEAKKVKGEEKIPSDGYTVSTQEAAQKALTAINNAIESKDKIRAHLGAMQNRLENTITNLNVQAENLQAAESRISDVDVATEMTQFVRNQILTQSAVAMLGQANSLPQMAMQLIGG
ncbi:MAG: flagellin [Desulfovibrio sp.]|nr:flagellin [Desulfovibrio sp.]